MVVHLACDASLSPLSRWSGRHAEEGDVKDPRRVGPEGWRCPCGTELPEGSLISEHIAVCAHKDIERAVLHGVEPPPHTRAKEAARAVDAVRGKMGFLPKEPQPFEREEGARDPSEPWHFYLDPLGTDYYGDGSPQNPWLTVACVIMKMPNDNRSVIIHRASGSYPEDVDTICLPSRVTLKTETTPVEAADPPIRVTRSRLAPDGRDEFPEKAIGAVREVGEDRSEEMNLKTEALYVRCLERLKKIKDHKDEGYYAKAYTEDVGALLEMLGVDETMTMVDEPEKGT